MWMRDLGWDKLHQHDWWKFQLPTDTIAQGNDLSLFLRAMDGLIVRSVML